MTKRQEFRTRYPQVASERDAKVYYIVRSDTGCTCPDASERQMICKHQWASFISAAMTTWKMQASASPDEIRMLAQLHKDVPAGICRTIELEAGRAIEQLAA